MTGPPHNLPHVPAGAGCPFCAVSDADVLLAHGGFLARWDRYPATPGHALITPRPHVESYFDLDTAQAGELHATLRLARAVLDERYRPDGYNLGVNDGAVAGRTVDHLHVHLIPRYRGDTDDPRGGIRLGLPGGDPARWTTGTATTTPGRPRSRTDHGPPPPNPVDPVDPSGPTGAVRSGGAGPVQEGTCP